MVRSKIQKPLFESAQQLQKCGCPNGAAAFLYLSSFELPTRVRRACCKAGGASSSPTTCGLLCFVKPQHVRAHFLLSPLESDRILFHDYSVKGCVLDYAKKTDKRTPLRCWIAAITAQGEAEKSRQFNGFQIVFSAWYYVSANNPNAH